MRDRTKEWNESWGKLDLFPNGCWKEDITLHDVQEILASGAEVNDYTHSNGKDASPFTTPLCKSIFNNRDDIFDLLIKQKCEKETLNHALFTAATNSNVHATEKLLQAGADPNSECGEYWAPNALAFVLFSDHYEPEILQKRREIAKLLLEHGATPNATSSYQNRSCTDDIILKTVQEYKDGKLAKKWIKEHLNPTKDELLSPIANTDENVITALVRAGSDVLDQVFPMDKWATMEAIPELKEIFAGVPREEALIDTMHKFDSKLRTTYNLNQRREERKKQHSISVKKLQGNQGGR